MTADRRPLATIDEVAEFLQIPVKTLYDWRLRRTGPKVSKIGNHLRYRWSDIDAWVEQQSASAA